MVLKLTVIAALSRRNTKRAPQVETCTTKESTMRTLTALSVCTALTLSVAAFAQSAPDSSKAKSLQQNASPNGAGGAAKQSGAPNTESGPAKGTSQAASATENNKGTGTQTPKMQGDTTKVK
jgi:hypothetical protein